MARRARTHRSSPPRRLWPAVAALAALLPAFAAAQTRADTTLSALLAKAERQIAAGHGTEPPHDNALDTWFEVLAASLPPTSAHVNEIRAYATDLRSRSNAEAAAGRDLLSVTYAVFAGMAEGYLAHVDDGGPAPPQKAAQALPAPGPAPAPEPGAPPAVTDAVAAAPEPGAPPAAASVPAAAPAVPPPPAQAAASAPWPVHPDAEAAAIYLARGDAMLAAKDISAARRFYALAAEDGSASAASALALTYDPAGLRQLGAIGPRPDPVLAALWYRRAQALGDAGAAARLERLAREVPSQP